MHCGHFPLDNGHWALASILHSILRLSSILDKWPLWTYIEQCSIRTYIEKNVLFVTAFR